MAKHPRHDAMFRGSITALVTPFRGGAVDFAALDGLVDRQIAGGTDALVVNGTTAESPCLTDEESLEILRRVRARVAGRIPVFYGSGGNDTRHAVERSRAGAEAGADALLVVTPYYNKPPQEGLYRHFAEIARAVDLPVILYNVPGRTGVNLEPNTVFRLSELPNVAAVKEASGNLAQMMRIRELCGDGIILLSGDDPLTLPILAIGGSGVISVTSNVAPAQVKRSVAAWLEGRPKEARELHEALLPLHTDLFLEANPIPVKTALFLMGLIALEFRPPLCEMQPANLARLKATLAAQKLPG